MYDFFFKFGDLFQGLEILWAQDQKEIIIICRNDEPEGEQLVVLGKRERLLNVSCSIWG
jgi:hypothetical protein